MHIIGVMILIVLGGAAAALLAMRYKIKTEEKRKYYRAAQRILREEYLDGAIKNAESMGLYSNEQRMMIALKMQGNKGAGYVFDPTREVRIGRSRERNDICVQDLATSGEHCKIFLYEGQLCIEDLNSSNGTICKRRFGGTQTLFGKMAFLQNHTRIKVGNNCFMLTIFYCDVSAE